MRAWMLDAKDIREEDQFTRDSIHETSAITKFLETDRVTKNFLVATKGFGKTLLLKTKRLVYGRPGVQLVPTNQLLDKPLGAPRVFTQSEVNDILADDTYWTQVWLISILCSVLRTHAAELVDQLESPCLQKTLRDTHRKTPTDFFVNVLSMNRNEYFLARRDLDSQLTPRYRSLKLPTAIFLDNIDEFFDVHLAHERLESSITGPLHRSFWYGAQIGLVLAVWQLTSSNEHVKIFCSVRKEAFSKLSTKSPLFQQIVGSSLDLAYSKEDLVDIFLKNIEMEPTSNLREPRKVRGSKGKSSQIAAFVGTDCTAIRHRFTGEIERFEDYVYRHTLGRPRDIVHIGMIISDLRPDLRTLVRVMDAVNAASTEIAKQYLAEVSPHIGELDMDAFYRTIHSNMLTREQAITASKNYDQATNGDHHIFCNLYKVGLLGTLNYKTGSGVQEFVSPGKLTFADNGVLPDADVYIIHPSLDHMINDRSREYFRHYNRLNIAGNNRPYITPSSRSFIVKGDIISFSSIMSHPDFSSFERNYKDNFRRIMINLRFAEQSGGDSFTIIDQNGHLVVSALRALADFLRSSEFELSFRAGGEFGVVEIGDGGPASAEALRTAARLEQLGNRGTLLVTASFANELRDRYAEVPRKFESEVLPANDRGEFNVAKSDKDRDTWLRLFTVPIGPD